MHQHRAVVPGFAMLLAFAGGTAAEAAPNEPTAPPADVQAATSVPGVRYVADAGYALTFPADWWVDPDVDETVVDRPGGTRVHISLMAEGPASEDSWTHEGCHMSHRLSEGMSLASMVAELAAAATVHEDVVTQPAEIVMLDLPAGPAARLEYTLSYPRFTSATTAYLLTDGTLLHVLHCSGPERPSDSWSSIAESLEFLTD